MENGLKLLLIAASAIVVCVVCVIGFSITKEGKNNVNNTTEQFTSLTSSYDDIELSIFHGMTISGAELVDVIKANETSIVTDKVLVIEVITKGNQAGNGTSGVVYDSSNYSKLKENMKVSNSTDHDYINPSGKFVGDVHRSSNGVIDKVTFTQS